MALVLHFRKGKPDTRTAWPDDDAETPSGAPVPSWAALRLGDLVGESAEALGAVQRCLSLQLLARLIFASRRTSLFLC